MQLRGVNAPHNDTFSKLQGCASPSPNSVRGLLTRWTRGSEKIPTAGGPYLTECHCKRHYVCLHIALPRTLVRHERHTMNHPIILHRQPQTLLLANKQMIALSQSEAAGQTASLQAAAAATWSHSILLTAPTTQPPHFVFPTCPCPAYDSLPARWTLDLPQRA